MPKKTKITIEHGDVKVTTKLPWDADIFMMSQVIAGLLKAVGFSEEVIQRGFKGE